MYLTIKWTDETGSCCLLIMFGDGPMYKVLGDEFSFSQCIDPMLVHEIFQTPFSKSKNNIKSKLPSVAHQKQTHYANRQLLNL